MGKHNAPADVEGGPLSACFSGVVKLEEGQTCSGKKCSAEAQIFNAEVPDGGILEITYLVWSNGERDVRILEARNTSRALRRLEHGLRLGIHTIKHRDWIELGQARMKSPAWAGKFKATRSQLDEGAKVPVVEVLEGYGADAIGTKEQLLGDSSKKRGYLCAVFKRSSYEVPVAAYMLTRVLPIINGYCVD